MSELAFDTVLFAELYEVQPQAITWLQAIWNDDQSAIVDFEYVYSNSQGLRYLNLTPESQRGLRLSRTHTLPPVMREAILKEMIQIYHTGIPSETNVFNPVLNKYVRVTRSRLRDGVISVVEDRTEEMRIIQELEAQKGELDVQKTLLDNILKNSSNGISVSRVMRDESGKVVDALTIMANDAAVRFIGLPPEIYFTKTATEIEPDIIGSPYYQQCIHTLETGESFITQYRMQANDRWLELTVSRLDRDHLIHIFTDVTPLKEVQLQLEKAAGTLKAVFDSAAAGMCTLVPVEDEKGEVIDFRFSMANRAIAEYLGRDTKEIEGKKAGEWMPVYYSNGLFELMKDAYAKRSPRRHEMHVEIGDDQKYFDLQAVRIDHQLLVTITDHSSLRESQVRLEQMVDALERSNVNLEDFAHAASHDLKEPLRKVRTFADRLQLSLADRLNESEKLIFKKIETSAERMQLLVEDLLEFSHVSIENTGMEAIDLNMKIQKVLSDLELLIEEKGAVVHTGSMPTVMGNRRQIQQLFQNLISNSLKYSREGLRPEIHISSETIDASQLPERWPMADALTGNFYHIRIRDNGIGFEPEFAERIFEMFQRLHGKAEYSGTGVGLSIARKVVQNHGGYIWAEGRPGEGSTFNIILPANE